MTSSPSTRSSGLDDLPVSSSPAPGEDDSDSRVRSLRLPFWIGYNRAKRIRGQLDALAVEPRHDRMPGLAVIGETNNGKTTILKRFVEDMTPAPDPDSDRTALPVVMLQTPPAPDEARLYDVLLRRFHAAGPAKEGTQIKLDRLILILRGLETKILILDEFSNALAGSPKQVERFLNAMKYIMNELAICMVIAGVPKALNVITSDPQLSNRLLPAILPRWEGKAYSSLLLSYEQVLGLREQCEFKNTAFVERMLAETGGLIGETDQLLRLLAARAIVMGTERIGRADLSADVLASLSWVAPSKRAALTTT